MTFANYRSPGELLTCHRQLRLRVSVMHHGGMPQCHEATLAQLARSVNEMSSFALCGWSGSLDQRPSRCRPGSLPVYTSDSIDRTFPDLKAPGATRSRSMLAPPAHHPLVGGILDFEEINLDYLSSSPKDLSNLSLSGHLLRPNSLGASSVNRRSNSSVVFFLSCRFELICP